jgi:replication fork protection complex subunit Csm3/Swi3
MLNMYQLWLDDFYPRAKFADGLAIIEKLGHTKRVQYMRKQWIDEGKPRHATEQDEDDVEPIELDQTLQADREHMEGVETENLLQSQEGGASRHELIDGTGDTAGATVDGDPDMDELDALLAESAGPTMLANLQTKAAITQVEDPFADEMEAMAEIEDW